jgi:hypothetical protein
MAGRKSMSHGDSEELVISLTPEIAGQHETLARNFEAANFSTMVVDSAHAGGSFRDARWEVIHGVGLQVESGGTFPNNGQVRTTVSGIDGGPCVCPFTCLAS